LRLPPLFFPTEIVTFPLPVPLPPEMLIQDVLLDAVQAQPLAVCTLIDLSSPFLPIFTLSGDTEYVHAGANTAA